MKTKVLSSLKCLLLVFMGMMAGKPVFAQNFSWAQRWGAVNEDQVLAMETDDEGNVYVIGLFLGTVDFDYGPDLLLLNGNSLVLFVGKYNPSGEPYWVKAFLGKGSWLSKLGCDITVDKDRNVYTTGVMARGTIDFDPGPGVENLSVTSDYSLQSFVCKLDADGNFEWVKNIGKDVPFSRVEATSIAIDGNTDIYLTGHFEHAADFDPGPSVYELDAGSTYDAFISKLDASGNFLWAKRLGGSIPHMYDATQSYSLALDGDGAVYTTGSFVHGADFDPGPGVYTLPAGWSGPSEAQDIFVSKLDTDGNFVWAKQIGSDNNDERGFAIAVDAQKNVYTVGDFGSGADFDPGAGVFSFAAFAAEKLHTYISKLDAAGDFVWARTLNDQHQDAQNRFEQDLVLDNNGNLYVSVPFSGTVDFNTAPASTPLTSAGMADGFVGKWDASGSLIWGKAYGGTDKDLPTSIAVDGQDNVYTAGRFYATADFNPDTGVWNLTSVASADAFLLKLSSCLPTQGQQDVSLCKAIYHWPLNGEVYTESGAYLGIGQTSTGCDSMVYLNLELTPLVSYEYMETCGSYTWPITGQTYTASGTYADTLLIAGGCDSVRRLVLVINNGVPDNGIIQSSADALTATQQNGNFYSWLDCNNNNAVLASGDDAVLFYPAGSGSYAVSVTMGGCVGVSPCFSFESDMDIDEPGAADIRLYPNPVQDRLTVETTGNQSLQAVEVTDVNGRKLYQIQVTGSLVTVPTDALAPGVYFVRVGGATASHIYKVCKQ